MKQRLQEDNIHAKVMVTISMIATAAIIAFSVYKTYCDEKSSVDSLKLAAS